MNTTKTASLSAAARPAPGGGERWRHAFFHKDKLRVRERYWRRQRPPSSQHQPGRTRVLPDALVWRRYLPLIEFLVEHQKHHLQQEQPTHNVTSAFPVLQWIVLESAAELMDWRNLNNCVQHPSTNNNDNGHVDAVVYYTREMTAPRERTQLLQLLEEHDDCVIPWCDLSVRDADVDCDEFDILHYASMSVVERSRRALVRAGRWLAEEQEATAQENRPVILLVGSREEQEAICDDDCMGGDNALQRWTMAQFIQWMQEHIGNSSNDTKVFLQQVQDLCQRCDEDSYKRQRRSLSAVMTLSTSTISTTGTEIDAAVHEYWSEQVLQQGLQQGTLVQGRLQVSKQNPQEAFVHTNAYIASSSTSGQQLQPQAWFVNQRNEHFNRALHGDVVILLKLPESQWERPVGRRKIVVASDNDGDDEKKDDGDNDDDETPAVPSGRVVGIAATQRQRRTTYVATLVNLPLNDESHIIVVPMDVRIPKIRVATKGGWKKYMQQRLWVEIDGWDVGSNYPNGRCIETLGPIGDMEVEVQCLLLEHEIQLGPWSAAARACLPVEGNRWTVPEDDLATRRDLRTSRRIFSVDPPGCQDIDDTMHAEVLPNSDIEVGVHIADVTHFVPHNSPLDKQAQKRGTTFYLVDRRFDMLPSLLSSDLCSLHGGVDRLAVSVIWTLSPDLETVKSVWYGRTVIHNCQAMTYDQAHNILHDQPPDEPGKVVPPLTAGYPVDLHKVPQLKKDLTILRDLGRKLKQRRENVGGAVDLSSGDLGGELKFTLDKNGNPVAVKPKKELEIHNTIAEMMIMANGYVATKIFDSFPEAALLRIHRTVEDSRFEGLKNVLDIGGVSMEGSSNMELANTLKKVEKAGAVVNSLIKSLATRAMSEAQYVCTGQQKDGLDLSHYGLGVDRYTHFTSPIRRYADVVVHKQLLAAMEKERITSAMGPEAARKARAAPHHPILPSIPDSNVISIMAGEGLDDPGAGTKMDEDVDGDDFLDSLIEGASELVVGAKTTTSLDVRSETKTEETESKHDSSKPYFGSEVTKIAESLNRQNRMAKHSSMECQNLFLSLYFRDHEETAQGVVTDLRVNGFYVYIPKFDISGPVYIRDTNGHVQMDPSLLGLPQSAGQPATFGFAASSTCRRFTAGKCKLVESSNSGSASFPGSEGGARLEVAVPGSKQVFTVRTLDIVMVHLRCDNWDVRSRVPPPRFLLVSKGTRPPPGFRHVSTTATTTTKINTKVLQNVAAANEAAVVSEHLVSKSTSSSVSIYDILQNIPVHPVLTGVPLRSRKARNAQQGSNVSTVDRREVFQGRLVFGKFQNPDETSATQQAAIDAASQASAQRRVNAAQTMERRGEFDSVRTIEKSVMARTQRLAADKRNTRRSKAK